MKACDSCNELFAPAKPWARFCSDVCRVRGFRAKNGGDRAIVRKDGRELRRLTLYLPAELAKRLAVHAAEADREMSDVATEAVEAALNRRERVAAIGRRVASEHDGILRALSATDDGQVKGEGAMGEQASLFDTRADARVVLVAMTDAQARAWHLAQAGISEGNASRAEPDAVPVACGNNATDPADLGTRSPRVRHRDAEAAAHAIALERGIDDAGLVSKEDRFAYIDAHAVSFAAIRDALGGGIRAGLTAAVAGALVYAHGAASAEAVAIAKGLKGRDANPHSFRLNDALRRMPPFSKDDKLRRSLVISAVASMARGAKRTTLSFADASKAKAWIDAERAKHGLAVPPGEDRSVYVKGA